MIRKITTAFFGAGLIGTLAFSPAARANGNNSAHLFHSIDGHDACFTHLDNGVYRNSNSGDCTDASDLIAPIIFNGAATSGTLDMWVDGNCATGYITCSIESFNYDGSYVGSDTVVASGLFDQEKQFDVSYWGYAEIQCSFPQVGGSCRLYGFDVVQ